MTFARSSLWILIPKTVCELMQISESGPPRRSKIPGKTVETWGLIGYTCDSGSPLLRKALAKKPKKWELFFIFIFIFILGRQLEPSMCHALVKDRAGWISLISKWKAERCRGVLGKFARPAVRSMRWIEWKRTISAETSEPVRHKVFKVRRWASGEDFAWIHFICFGPKGVGVVIRRRLFDVNKIFGFWYDFRAES